MTPPEGATEAREASRPLSLGGEVAERIADDLPFDAELPGGGRVHMDRALPFLVAYRSPPGRADAGARDLVSAVASYLAGPGEEGFRNDLDAAVGAIAAAARARLGRFLLVEVWTLPADEGEDADGARRPMEVTVVLEEPSAFPEAEALRASLESARLCPENGGDLGVAARLERVALATRARATPPGLPPLLEGEPCLRLGVEVSPFFRDAGSGKPFPRVLAALRRELGRAIEEAAFHFAQERTTLDVPHPRALGRREVDRAVRHVDARLGEIYDGFDTLLQVTPVNGVEAWESFRASGFERAPALRYRPLPFDPEETKRRLFHVPIERVEDPLLNHLFREKQEELDLEITLLRGLETEAFRWVAYQLHGTVDDALLELAHGILDTLPPRRSAPGPPSDDAEDGEEPDFVGAREFARRATREIDYYRARLPDFQGGVQIRDDVASGLMVSKGVLLVGEGLRTPRGRVEALLQHEVGTHVVTFANGTRQPLRLFAAGLAGYEALQEGLAVLAEYLVGGLTSDRARVLAARVVAVRAFTEGADFVATWRLLARERGFSPRAAFLVTLRVYRGGGYTKDAVYLRGLRDLLVYLGDGGSLDRLLVGKVGLSHADAVQELMLRGVLKLPGVKPRYLSDPAVPARLEACRGRGVLDLLSDLAA